MTIGQLGLITVMCLSVIVGSILNHKQQLKIRDLETQNTELASMISTDMKTLSKHLKIQFDSTQVYKLRWTICKASKVVYGT